MPRYIDADKVLTDELTHTLPNGCGMSSGRVIIFVDDIEKIPTADVQEVRHGKWIGYPSITISKRRRTIYSITYQCSCCGKSNGRAKSPYCKNCGAKMGGKEVEEKK